MKKKRFTFNVNLNFQIEKREINIGKFKIKSLKKK